MNAYATMRLIRVPRMRIDLISYKLACQSIPFTVMPIYHFTGEVEPDTMILVIEHQAAKFALPYIQEAING